MHHTQLKNMIRKGDLVFDFVKKYCVSKFTAKIFIYMDIESKMGYLFYSGTIAKIPYHILARKIFAVHSFGEEKIIISVKSKNYKE